jgi:co-chaperonin GroES (HSP10)
VQRVKAETKTASGIFLPESSVKELNEARVLAVGPGGLDKEGKRVAVSVAPGDRVLIPQVGFFRACVQRVADGCEDGVRLLTVDGVSLTAG